jgi:galactose mutarotase-like enzyme
MPTCTIAMTTLEQGMRAVELTNPFLSVTILPDKGADIYRLIHRASGVDLLLKAPQGLRAPGHGVLSADNHTAWMEMYEGGWQECLPNGGDVCHYKGLDLNFHGESTTLPWQTTVLTERDDAVEVEFSVQLYRSPLKLRRRMLIDATTPRLRLAEQVTNLAGEPIDLMWGHHPAFGAPFVAPGMRIHTNAQTLLADREPGNVLTADVRSDWPLGALPNGATCDLSVGPAADEPRATLAYLLDFDGDPWYALTNAQLGLGVGVTWSAETFRCCWLCQEMRASTGFPFYSDMYTMAIEPWSSYPGHGLAHVMETNGTHLTLEAGAERTASLTMTLFKVDPAQRIARVATDGTVIFEDNTTTKEKAS